MISCSKQVMDEEMESIINSAEVGITSNRSTLHQFVCRATKRLLIRVFTIITHVDWSKHFHSKVMVTS